MREINRLAQCFYDALNCRITQGGLTRFTKSTYSTLPQIIVGDKRTVIPILGGGCFVSVEERGRVYLKRGGKEESIRFTTFDILANRFRRHPELQETVQEQYPTNEVQRGGDPNA